MSKIEQQCDDIGDYCIKNCYWEETDCDLYKAQRDSNPYLTWEQRLLVGYQAALLCV